jgi:hypothetical protein
MQKRTNFTKQQIKERIQFVTQYHKNIKKKINKKKKNIF